MEIISNKCDSCGICCQLFLINLNEEEYRSGEFKTTFSQLEIIDDFDLATECGANIIMQNSDGSCFYLENEKCSIHARRPQVCREFFCKGNDLKFAQMRSEIAAARALSGKYRLLGRTLYSSALLDHTKQ